MQKPFSNACENNKAAILNILRNLFSDCCHVLEVGSGTGQHAVCFGAGLPHLRWQTGDLEQNHPGIQLWLNEAGLPNVLPPCVLDADADAWPVENIDAIFTANTLHIVSWPQVQRIFQHAGTLLPRAGILAVYGPFNYNGEFTSDSNARFEQWLKEQNPVSGIRDFEAVSELAAVRGLKLEADYAMPANNRILVWRKI